MFITACSSIFVYSDIHRNCWTYSNVSLLLTPVLKILSNNHDFIFLVPSSIKTHHICHKTYYLPYNASSANRWPWSLNVLYSHYLVCDNLMFHPLLQMLWLHDDMLNTLLSVCFWFIMNNWHGITMYVGGSRYWDPHHLLLIS